MSFCLFYAASHCLAKHANHQSFIHSGSPSKWRRNSTRNSRSYRNTLWCMGILREQVGMVYAVCRVVPLSRVSSVLNLPTVFPNNSACTPVRLGYRVVPAFLALTGQAVIAQDIEKALTVYFVLHPVAAALTLLALLSAIPASRSRCWCIVTLIIEVISAVLTTVVLAVQFTLIDELTTRISPLNGGSFDVDFGNCPWIVLGATLLIWISVAMSSAVACKCCGCGRRREWDW
jgi:SUR7/PalI family